MQNQIPKNWQKVKLGNAGFEVRDLYEPTQNEALPYIGLEHIEQQSLRLLNTGLSSETQSTKKKFFKEDILFGTLRPYFRKVVIPKFDGVCSTDITVLRAKSDYDQKYLFYFIANEQFIDYATNSSNGTRMPRANWKTISDSEWYFPPIYTQQKIASILSAFDDLIENNNRQIKILEEMAQAIFKEWFALPSVALAKEGKLPKGWEIKRVKDFGLVVTGKTPSKAKSEYYGDYMPFIKTPDMHGNIFCIKAGESLSEAGTDSQKNKILPINSICVSCIGTAGVVTITTQASQTNQQINSIVLKNQIDREFLFFALKNLENTINMYGANGATMVNLNKSKFESLQIVYPSADLVSSFHTIVNPMFELIKSLQFKNCSLYQTRDLLLPKLMRGEARV